jgi:hypothetical protein
MSRVERVRFLLGAVLLTLVIQGVVPNLVSNYVQQNFLVSTVVIAAMSIVYLLLLWVENHFAKQSRMELTLVQKENPTPRKGLIVFMSPGTRTTPAENAVKAHLAALEHCWVISGPDRPGHKPTSSENAETLKGKFQRAKTTSITFHLKPLLDEDDPQKSYYLVRSIYEEAKAFGLSERDIIADYTGGTKSMTAGMVLACSTSEERDAEYMKALQVTSTGTASPSAEAVPVMVDLKFGSPK